MLGWSRWLLGWSRFWLGWSRWFLGWSRCWLRWSRWFLGWSRCWRGWSRWFLGWSRCWLGWSRWGWTGADGALGGADGALAAPWRLLLRLAWPHKARTMKMETTMPRNTSPTMKPVSILFCIHKWNGSNLIYIHTHTYIHIYIYIHTYIHMYVCYACFCYVCLRVFFMDYDDNDIDISLKAINLYQLTTTLFYSSSSPCSSQDLTQSHIVFWKPISITTASWYYIYILKPIEMH